jgi:hypothetical protein
MIQEYKLTTKPVNYPRDFTYEENGKIIFVREVAPGKYLSLELKVRKS